MIFPSKLKVALSQLVNNSPSIRKLGAQTICSLKPPEELPLIREAFRLEKNHGVAKWLARTLGEMNDTDSTHLLEARLRILEDGDLRDWVSVSLNMLRGFKGRKCILRLLESSDPFINKEGLILSWNNPKVGGRNTVQQKLLLESQDSSVRRWASLVIGSQKGFKPDEQIIEHLSDPDYLALEWTEHVMTGIVPNEAIETLNRNLDHQQPRVREWAINALASCGIPGMFNLLIQQYKKETDVFCKDAVIRSLQPISSTSESIEFFLSCAKTETSPVILSALIYLAANDSSLLKNTSLKRAIFANIDRTDNISLKIALAQACAANLKSSDLELLQQLDNPEDAKIALEMFSNLPPDTGKELQILASQMKIVRGMNMDSHNSECDVAILIAKKEEFRYFLELIDDYTSNEDSETSITSYHFQLRREEALPVRIVALFAGGMGNERSALYTQELIRKSRPNILVNIGIAGGLHEDVKLGDIVVANQVDNYLAGSKAIPANNEMGFEYRLSGDPFKTTASLVKKIMNLEFAYSGAFTELKKRCKEDSEKIITINREGYINKSLMRQEPTTEDGHVACGPSVGASESFITWLKNNRDRSYLAIEMESAGSALAIHEFYPDTQHLVVRGISDFADERKNELDLTGNGEFRQLAMRNATRLLFLFLKSTDAMTVK